MSKTKQADEQNEEDATELKFPKGTLLTIKYSLRSHIHKFPEISEFETPGCDALMISEVFLLLDHRRKQSEDKEEIEEISEVFLKTLDYTRRLSKFKSRDTIRAVRG
jgi:hypothetical protein